MSEETENEIDLLEGEGRAVKSDTGMSATAKLEDAAYADDGSEAERKDAFDEGFFKWKGKDLNPFTSSRDSLFCRMRTLMGAPDIQVALSDLSLFVGDAHLILFLCSSSEFDLARKIGKPEALLQEMLEWAGKNIEREEANEAVETALLIYVPSRTNSAEQAPDDDALAASGLGN